VLAAGVRDAYADLFRINRDANKLSREQLAGKLKSLGEGKISPAILTNTIKTFTELVKIADFSGGGESSITIPAPEEPDSLVEALRPDSPSDQRNRSALQDPGPALVYRIEIVLPAVRDQAIYDAIFKSAKEHLLK
jgi:hypothetical protein